MFKKLPSGSIIIDNDKLFVLDSRGIKSELDDFISSNFDSEIDKLVDELKVIFRFCDVKMVNYGEIVPVFVKRMVNKKNTSTKSNIMHFIKKMKNAKNLSDLNVTYNELISIIKDVKMFSVNDRDKVNDYLDSYMRSLHATGQNIILPSEGVEDYLLPSGQSVRDFRECFAENSINQKKIIIEYVQTLHSFLQAKILFEQRVDRVKQSGVSEIKVESNVIYEKKDSINNNIKNNEASVQSVGIDGSEYDIIDLTDVHLKDFDNFPENVSELGYGIILDEKTLFARENTLDELMSKINLCERWLIFLSKFSDDTYIRHVDVINFDDVAYIESVLSLKNTIICSSDDVEASSVLEEMKFFSEQISNLTESAYSLKSQIDFLRSKISINCKIFSSLVSSDEIDKLGGMRKGTHR